MNEEQKKEAAKESSDRLKEFMEKYKFLCEKYSIDMIGVPRFAPVTDFAWGIQIGVQPVDMKGVAQKSPIQPNEGLK